jgi:hypothetical protein
MGRPSKFTADRRERILQAKRVGASNRTAARVAGISPSVLADWLKRGETGLAESNYHQFWEEFEEASAHPRERALGIIYNALPDRPDLAWKYIERREDGYAPPIQAPAIAQVGPVNVMLSFIEATRPAVAEVIDVGTAEPTPSGPAALPARASH